MNDTQEATFGEGGAGRRWKVVYTIVEGRDGKKHWLRIGAAFENKDGSWNVRLDAMPVNGTLHIRDPEPVEGREGRGATGTRRESGRDAYATQGVL